MFSDNEDPTPDSSCESKKKSCQLTRMCDEDVLRVMPNLNSFVQMFGNIPNVNCGYGDLWLI